MPNMFNNNFGMVMNFNFMPNMMMNNNINFIPNMMMNNNINQKKSNIDMSINIFFNADNGAKIHVKAKFGTTADQLLQKYLNKIGKPELYEQKNANIWFLYNGERYYLGDATPVEKIFENSCCSVMVSSFMDALMIK